jgi:muramoyltetrapeptide carboxypeptidase
MSLSVASTFIYSSFLKSETKSENRLTRIFPRMLKEGDRIAIVSPGSYLLEDELQIAVRNISELGFEVTFSDKLLLQNGYFSGTDQQRAQDLIDMFEREDVKGIICARGGYGCSRILPLLDYNIIKQNPKVLIGYSDVTALLFGIYKNTGLITFHGPVAISTFNNFSVRNFNSVLMNKSFPLKMKNANEDIDENPYGVIALVEGKAKGELIGGNLSIMVSLIGTDYDLSYDNKIIFIEEVGEEPYRIDRMLTQLIQAKKFDKAAGIMMGVLRNCEPKTDNPSFVKSFTLMEVLKDRLGSLKIPVIYGMSFGHIKNKFTIPFGLQAELDTDEQTFSLEESPVI